MTRYGVTSQQATILKNFILQNKKFIFNIRNTDNYFAHILFPILNWLLLTLTTNNQLSNKILGAPCFLKRLSFFK